MTHRNFLRGVLVGFWLGAACALLPQLLRSWP
jgi:gas vesicle protein